MNLNFQSRPLEGGKVVLIVNLDYEGYLEESAPDQMFLISGLLGKPPDVGGMETYPIMSWMVEVSAIENILTICFDVPAMRLSLLGTDELAQRKWLTSFIEKAGFEPQDP